MLIELLSNYGLFLLKTITIVVSILLIISAIINSKKSNTDVNLTVKNINTELDELEKSIKKNIFNKSEYQSKRNCISEKGNFWNTSIIQKR